MISRLREIWRRSGWREFVLLLSVGTFVVCVWIFLELADDAPEGDYLPIEEKVLLAFRQPDNLHETIGPWWLKEMGRDITALGGGTVLTIVTLLVLGYLLLRTRYRTALFIAVSIAGGYIVSDALKHVFARERPTVVPHLMDVASASFPSGHSMSSSVVYLTLGALLARTIAERRREKIYLIAAVLLLVFLVGVSRVFLGVHYPTDVLAGWTAGIAWALLCWMTASWLQSRGKLRQTSDS